MAKTEIRLEKKQAIIAEYLLEKAAIEPYGRNTEFILE